MKKIAQFILSFILALIFVDMGARILVPHSPEEEFNAPLAQEHSTLGWAFQGSAQKNDGHKIVYNTQGLRDQASSLNGLPLLFLGDSMLAALDLPAAETLSSQLGGVNAGAPGYSLAQIQKFFRSILHLRPQTVVLVLIPERIKLVDSAGDLKRTLLFNPQIQLKSSFLNLLKNSGVFRALKWILEKGQKDDETNIKKALQTELHQNLPTTKREIIGSIFQELAKGAEKRFLIFFVPSAASLEIPGKLTLNESLLALCQEQKISCYDLKDELLLEQNRNLFLDLFHYNSSGHKVLAKIMQKYLTP